MRAPRPLLAVTMGDPAGIGPEIVVQALASDAVSFLCRPVVIGDAGMLRSACRLTGTSLPLHLVREVSDSEFCDGALNVLDLANVDHSRLVVGRVSRMCGRASLEYIHAAIDLAKRRVVQAMVTGPIHKEAVALAGCPHAGHTEILATATGARDYAMMLVVGALRVVHTTTHIPLAQVPSRVTKSRVEKVIALAQAALEDLGIRPIRIAVAGLNPHASDGGLFGSEEAEEIAPAIVEAQREGLQVEGPIAPDTVFVKHASGQYDVVVAMYHDQGHIPLKFAGFRRDEHSGNLLAVSGVNITLGLPIVRTSVDHGVAFDLAGKGTARPESLCEAIQLATRLCGPGQGREPV